MDIVRDATKKIVGKDNPLVEELGEKEEMGDRHGVAYAIRKLSEAACDLYCEGDLSWDEAVDNLSKAVGKLKGKEDTLKKAYKADVKKEGPMMGGY